MWKTLPWMVTKVLLFFLRICSHEAYSGNVGLFLRRGWIAWTFWVTVNHPTCITNHWWTNYLLFFFLGFWGGEVVISKSVITPFVFQLTTRLLDNVSDGSNQCWETWRNWQEWVCLHFLHLIFCIYIYMYSGHWQKDAYFFYNSHDYKTTQATSHIPLHFPDYSFFGLQLF